MPVMSDQMLDRLKASADKKAKKMQDQQQTSAAMNDKSAYALPESNEYLDANFKFGGNRNNNRQFTIAHRPHSSLDIPVDETARFEDPVMSELTQTYHHNKMQGNQNVLFPQTVVKEIEANDTEFTEQFELSLHNISHEGLAENVEESVLDEQKTIQDDESQGMRVNAKVLNHDTVKTKYAPDSSRPSSHIKNNSSRC